MKNIKTRKTLLIGGPGTGKTEYAKKMISESKWRKIKWIYGSVDGLSKSNEMQDVVVFEEITTLRKVKNLASRKNFMCSNAIYVHQGNTDKLDDSILSLFDEVIHFKLTN